MWIKFRVDKISRFSRFLSKKIISTRNRLKWGQPRNLIHAKFNFWTAFFSRFLKGLHEEKNTSSNTLYTSTVLTTKKFEYLLNLMLLELVLRLFRRLFVCRYCPRFFLMLILLVYYFHHKEKLIREKKISSI